MTTDACRKGSQREKKQRKPGYISVQHLLNVCVEEKMHRSLEGCPMEDLRPKKPDPAASVLSMPPPGHDA
jgi:hypothetical protein